MRPGDPPGHQPARFADRRATIRNSVHMIETITAVGAPPPAVRTGPAEPTSEEIAKRMYIPVSKVRKILRIAQESDFAVN